MSCSPASVRHHNELVPLSAVANGELDLPQRELAECRATVKPSAAAAAAAGERRRKQQSRSVSPQDCAAQARRLKRVQRKH